MRFVLALLALMLLPLSSAHAMWPGDAAQQAPRHAVHEARHHAHHVERHREARSEDHVRSGLTTISTAAGIPIVVASHLAQQFESLVADFVAAGYRPRAIHCYAHGGHVTHSRHYAGAACDFDQRGWGRTAPFMYSARAHAIIIAHGLRDGREFHDQGHVDDGGVRYARNVHRSRYGG